MSPFSHPIQKSEILTSSLFKNALIEKNMIATNNAKALETKKMKHETFTQKKMTIIKNIQDFSKYQETESNICGETFEENWIFVTNVN